MYRPEFEWELGETITKTYEDGELETNRDTDHLELTMPAMWESEQNIRHLLN